MKKSTKLQEMCKNYNKTYTNITINHIERKKLESNLLDYVKKNGPFAENGYYYYIRNPYKVTLLNVHAVKTNYPEVYAKCCYTREIKEKLMRRIINA